MKQDDAPTLADLAATPAEVALDRIPERLGEIERRRAMPWARITDAWPDRAQDRLPVAGEVRAAPLSDG